MPVTCNAFDVRVSLVLVVSGAMSEIDGSRKRAASAASTEDASSVLSVSSTVTTATTVTTSSKKRQKKGGRGGSYSGNTQPYVPPVIANAARCFSMFCVLIHYFWAFGCLVCVFSLLGEAVHIAKCPEDPSRRVRSGKNPISFVDSVFPHRAIASLDIPLS